MKRRAIILLAAVATLVLPGYGASAQAQAEQITDTGGEITVGGFEVRGTSVPEVTVEQETAQEYLDQVRPIAEDAARDLSQLIEPKAQLVNDVPVLGIEAKSTEQAKGTAEQGLKQLREVRPHEGLESVHERLVGAYEEALPAYDDVIEAFDSEDVDRLSAAARESLPQIERLSTEARSILQDLQQAAPPMQELQDQGPAEESLKKVQRRADRAEEELSQVEQEAQRLAEELEAEQSKGFLDRLFGG